MGLELKGFVFIQGSGGGSSENKFVWNENHSSEIDGVKYSFDTNYPFVTGWTKVKLNGQELTLNIDYVENNNTTLIFNFIPQIDDVLIFDYLKI